MEENESDDLGDPAETTYELAVPFWIDTDPYCDQDRDFFAFGFEYATVAHALRFDNGPLDLLIHRENESRVRMLAGHTGRRVRITQLGGADSDRSRVEVEVR